MVSHMELPVLGSVSICTEDRAAATTPKTRVCVCVCVILHTQEHYVLPAVSGPALRAVFIAL